MKKRFVLMAISLIFIVTFALQMPRLTNAEEAEVYLGGMPAGFIIDNKGATIIGVNDVISKDGLFSPAKDADIKAADILVSIDGKEVNCAADIEKILSDYDGNGATAVIERDGEVLIKIVYPVKDLCGKYRMGMFIRDDITGIGTVTYIKANGEFGSLGHPVVDGCSQRIVKINSGRIFNCNIVGVHKGERGRAGEIRGYFPEDKAVGEISVNKNEGIFGKITDKEFYKDLKKIAFGTPKVGKATIFSTVEGTCPKEYEINIIKVDKNAAENKNLVIKITDDGLLDKTGGILQGMSGSPIVQNGMLVGAVTHVFINDPARGFGIAIDKMAG